MPLPPVEHVTVADIPNSLLTHSGLPMVPDPKTATQKDVASFMARTFGDLGACYGNVDTIAGLLQSQKKALSGSK
jgi:hypothetical protein